MKKIFVMFGLVLTVLLTNNLSASAEDSATTTNTTDVVTEEPTTTTDDVVTEEPTDELPDAGTIPGDLFYGVDKFFENIALKLTFSDEKRAEKLAKIAEERLAELNALDPEKAALYADELFNEYGLNLEKATLYVQKLVAEGKISEEKLAKLEERMAKAEERQSRIKDNVKDKISNEVKDKVNEALKDAKMSIFNRFTDKEAINTLHQEGYGYGQLLRLQAIAETSSKTIDELLLIEGVVTTNEDNEKEINFQLLLTTLGLTQEDVHNKLSEYKDSARDTMKTKMDEVKQQAEERREEVKDRINDHVGGKKGN